MNLLIVGDRKPHNDSDLALAAFESAGHSVTFLYRGAPFPLAFGILAEDANGAAQVRAIVRERHVDVIYLRLDEVEELDVAHYQAILMTNFGVPLVLGYHGHACRRSEREAIGIARADALVLPNRESQAWIEGMYDVRKPTLLVPGLSMPRRAWYDVPLLPKRSAGDDRPHVVVPAHAIRVATVPDRPDPAVAVEDYVLDRDDYFRLCEQLLKRGVAVHFYGAFAARNGGDASAVEAAYRSLGRRYAGMLHFEAAVDAGEFASEVSRYDAALLTGFVPHQPVPKAEHVTYSPHLNTVLAARLPSLVAAGTSSCNEREIASTGAGFVFESIDRLVEKLRDAGQLQRASNAAHAAQDRHSAEPWTAPLATFFGAARDAYRLRRDTRAA